MVGTSLLLAGVTLKSYTNVAAWSPTGATKKTPALLCCGASRHSFLSSRGTKSRLVGLWGRQLIGFPEQDSFDCGQGTGNGEQTGHGSGNGQGIHLPLPAARCLLYVRCRGSVTVQTVVGLVCQSPAEVFLPFSSCPLTTLARASRRHFEFELPLFYSHPKFHLRLYHSVPPNPRAKISDRTSKFRSYAYPSLIRHRTSKMTSTSNPPKPIRIWITREFFDSSEGERPFANTNHSSGAQLVEGMRTTSGQALDALDQHASRHSALIFNTAFTFKSCKAQSSRPVSKLTMSPFLAHSRPSPSSSLKSSESTTNSSPSASTTSRRSPSSTSTPTGASRPSRTPTRASPSGSRAPLTSTWSRCTTARSA